MYILFLIRHSRHRFQDAVSDISPARAFPSFLPSPNPTPTPILPSATGLADFVNGAFDGLKILGLSDDFEKSRENLLKMAIKEDLNMDVNVTATTPFAYLPDSPSGWGPVFFLKVKMDMDSQADAKLAIGKFS